ncbi:MAG: hypothetical protein NT145_01010 [Elusimicrobia bacterium]|nr:hypothetical protein [Elusimicrobiota bacterium]
MKKYLLYIILLIFLFMPEVNCAELPFNSNSIKDSYGPRVHPARKNWDFHNGVDYSPLPGDADKGIAINAVEDGMITKLSYDDIGGGGWFIEIKSGNKIWKYFHLFEAGPLPKSGGIFKVGYDKEGLYLLRGKTNNWPERKIRINKDNERSGIMKGEPIAPVGTSGIGTGAHLHLILEQGGTKYNPLSELTHTEGAFAITIKNPKEGAVLKEEDLKTDFPVTVNIDMTNGKDLDEVTIFLDDKQINTGNGPTFNYGGKIGEGRKLMVESKGANTGIKPIANSFSRDFVYNYDFSKLEDGYHKIKVIVANTNGREAETENLFKAEKKYLGQISGKFLWYKGRQDIYGSYTVNFLTGDRSEWKGIRDVLLGLKEQDEITGFSAKNIPQEAKNDPNLKKAVSAFVPHQIKGKAVIAYEAPEINIKDENGKTIFYKKMLKTSSECDYIVGFWEKGLEFEKLQGLLEPGADSGAEIVLRNMSITINDSYSNTPYPLMIAAMLFSSKKDKDKYLFSNTLNPQEEMHYNGKGYLNAEQMKK